MDLIKLKNNYALALERNGSKVRLVIYQSGVENICRKESAKNLVKFSQLSEDHLFKGRLQLQKNGAGINVIVKGKPVGNFSAELLKALL